MESQHRWGACVCIGVALAWFGVGGGGCSEESSQGGAGAAGTGGSAGGAGGAAGQAGSGAGGAAGGGTPAEGQPPPVPDSPGAADGPGTVLGIRQLLLGDTDRDGSPNPEAWQQYGYNIDKVVSTPASAQHCRATSGGSQAAVQSDGPGGIDNSFGRNVLPIYAGLAPDFIGRVGYAFEQGQYTLLIAVDGIGTGANYAGLKTSVYEGAPLMHAPAWDGSDQWPVICEYLQLCDPGKPPPPPANPSKLVFASSWVNDHVWVSSPKGDVMIGLVWLSDMVKLNVHQATLTMRLGPESPAPMTGTLGVISGVLDTEEYLAEFQRLAGWLSTSLCDGAPWQALADQIRGASDIMKDGSQDPSAECDGISIGLGFEAGLVTLGDAVGMQPPPTDSCVP